jgi:hypothetical protein
VRTFHDHIPPPVIFTCQATSSFAQGVAVPIPTLPVVNIRAVSVLLVLNTRSCQSVVPTKFVPATVPELPSIDHTPETDDNDTQVARPAASDERTLLTHGAPHVILICQTTSSLAPGVIVPTPTLKPSS